MLDGYHISRKSKDLDRSYNIPDERSNTYFFVTKIKFLNGLKERGELFVLYHGDDAGVHLGPCVGATAGFTAVSTTTLYLLKERKAFDIQDIKHIFHTTGVCLIKNYHNRFHKK